MNTVKKIVAFAVVIFITFRLIVISVSASFAAPFMAEETLKTLFIEALGASGSYSADDLEAWDYNDLKDEFEIQMKTNPNFKPKNAIPFLVSPNPEDMPGTPEHTEKVMNDIRNLRKQNDEIITEWFNNLIENGSDLYDFINPTYNIPIDMQGRGGAYKLPFSNYNNGHIDGYEIWRFDYAEIVPRGDGSYYYRFHNVHRDIYHLNGEFWFTWGDDTVVTTDPKSGEERYGDWRFEDGTKFGTDDDPIPVIGEADGVQITPDMLNPDGTVTIDGTTYYPKDFIDLDKFKDTAIIDLLNQILAKIDTVPVADIDNTKDIVDDITGNLSIEVPEELTDYIVPSGISSVFPFCIPVDVYRGFKLLSRPAIAPKFEIPFNIPEFGLFKGYTNKVVLDFSEYDNYIKIFRYFQIIGFAFLLCSVTFKLVKGA